MRCKGKHGQRHEKLSLPWRRNGQPVETLRRASEIVGRIQTGACSLGWRVKRKPGRIAQKTAQKNDWTPAGKSIKLAVNSSICIYEKDNDDRSSGDGFVGLGWHVCASRRNLPAQHDLGQAPPQAPQAPQET